MAVKINTSDLEEFPQASFLANRSNRIRSSRRREYIRRKLYRICKGTADFLFESLSRVLIHVLQRLIFEKEIFKNIMFIGTFILPDIFTNYSLSYLVFLFNTIQTA